MKGLKAASRIALGQVSLLVAVLLLAFYLGQVPDRRGAIMEGRARLAEALAANSSAFLTQRDQRRIESNLRLVVTRDDNLLSAALRRDDGEARISIGDHLTKWRAMEGQHSSLSQVRVPIWTGARHWGQLELRFTPITSPGWLGVAQHPWLRLVAGVGLVSFVLFRVYLAKMLKHLDPSRAIPARVRTALDTMAEGLLVLDRDENVVLANLAFAATIGRDPDALLGMRPSSLGWTAEDGSPVSPEDYPWRRMFRSGDARRNELIHLDQAGSKRRTFLVNCSPILAGGQRPVGALVSFDDVTELEEKELALKRSMEEAEAANRAKSEFLANMSHEIRTPMNAILGFTDVLRRRPIAAGEEESRYLEIIHTSGKHLLELINDLLDLSKVESGRLEVERIPCAPHEILRSTLETLDVKAREKGITLELEIDGAVPATILSDPPRIRQIVTNLVGNAIRFTESGGVRVVERRVTTGSEPKLAIDVIDSGVGVPKEKLDAIFEAFVQADASITRRFGGTGLGLAISRKLARKLGGDITVTSRVGEGSCFAVTLATGSPENVVLLEPEEALAAEVESDRSAARWEFPRGRVLVADDLSANRELVRIVLEEAGLEVEEAENGAVALEMVQDGAFDVVLMDVQMPVMDGFTATRELRARGVGLPVYALTAHAMKGIQEECRAAGFSGHIPKPIDAEFLLETLAKVLEGARRAEGSPAAQPPPANAPCNDGFASEAGVEPIVSRFVGKQRMHRVIRRFPLQLASQLEGMEKAWAARDFATLKNLAHTLKGSGGTLGFDGFTEPSMQLEELAKQRREDGIEAAIQELRELERRVVVPEEDDR
jgi:PAS domain S-box-containing protein